MTVVEAPSPSVHPLKAVKKMAQTAQSSSTSSRHFMALCACLFLLFEVASLFADFGYTPGAMDILHIDGLAGRLSGSTFSAIPHVRYHQLQSEREEYWGEFVKNDSLFITYNINWNVSGGATVETLALPQPAESAMTIDVVSLCVKEDFSVLFGSKGILTFFRHIKNIRSLTLLGRPKELPLIQEQLRKYAAELEIGAKIEGSSAVVPPIHFVSEAYFQARYQRKYRCPYSRVCQQLMKLHIFDIPYLLDNVLMVDSDTAWGRDVEFVSADGKVTYVNDPGIKRCKPMDPVSFVNTLLNPSNASLSERDRIFFNRTTKGAKDLGCGFKYCGFDDSNGCRHILHHMLFQRDVMYSLHKDAMGLWGGDSMWAAVRNCWTTASCKGRVSEYELYFTYVDCVFHERVKEEFFPFVLAAGDCSVEEMKICRAKGVLLKGCHDHRIGQRVGYCAKMRTTGLV